jgi:hypothetical protein
MSATATAADVDLWPEDLEPKGEPSPSAILRQQGYRLGERTGDVIYGVVESQYESREFRHTLVLTASFLKFRQPLVLVTHKLDPYPAEASSLDMHGSPKQVKQVHDAKELREFLKDVFNSPTTVELVRSLRSQTLDADD